MIHLLLLGKYHKILFTAAAATSAARPPWPGYRQEWNIFILGGWRGCQLPPNRARKIQRKYISLYYCRTNPTPDPPWGQQSLRGLTQLYTFIRHQSLFWRRVHSTRAWSLQTWGKHLLCSHIHCTPARHHRACDQRWWGFIIVRNTAETVILCVLYITEWKVVTIAGDPLNV